MKVSHYAIDGPTKWAYKQHCILGREARSGVYSPIVYLQRPKWIKSDDCWQKIVNAIRLNIPKNFEVE